MPEPLVSEGPLRLPRTGWYAELSVVILALSGCADVQTLVAFQKQLAQEFGTPNIDININNGQALTVTFVNLPDPEAQQAALCKRAPAFVRDHYPSYAKLRTVSVGFATQHGAAGLSVSRSTVACTYSTTELGAPGTTPAATHARPDTPTPVPQDSASAEHGAAT